MRAALIDAATGIDTIRVGDASIASPGAGEVQIEVRASSVNFPDILMSEGAYQIKPPLPFTPGMEGAGTVCAVGSDVKDFKVGDRVLASVEFGTFAERMNAPAARCFPVPEAISFETAAAVGLAYQTAHFALCERGRMSPDDVVLVNGATGGVGLAAIRLAKALGAKTVIGSVASPKKSDIVMAAARMRSCSSTTRTISASSRIRLQKRPAEEQPISSSKRSAATCSTRACAPWRFVDGWSSWVLPAGPFPQ
jgi:NADPH2:quinone reductase